MEDGNQKKKTFLNSAGSGMTCEILILDSTFRRAPKTLSDQDEHDFNAISFLKNKCKIP